MPIDKALGIVGVALVMGPSSIALGLGFLIATIWSAFVRYRSAPSYLVWNLVAVTNLPLVVLMVRILANNQGALSDFDYGAFHVAMYSSGLGIGWLAGCIFGLLIRVGAVGVRDALQ
jgi:hypothetical protein